MEVWEFEELLRQRFRVRMTISDKPPKYVCLACKGCGWTVNFRLTVLETWSIDDKGGLSEWLLRHSICKKSFGT